MRPTLLECGRCARAHDASVPQSLCAACGKPLLARYDLEAAAPSMRPGVLRRTDLWRYLPVLPVAGEAEIVTLGEGWTPLLESPPLAHWAGLRRCLVKDEAGNPTGSFKARGMAVATAAARALGITEVFVPSAGNAAGALAAYAARAGLRATVAMPEDAPEPNRLECRAAGAETLLVRGTIADAAAALRARFRGSPAFDLSTMREPYRVEGKKTMGYEIFEQLGRLPDWIVYPCGGGTGVVGMWKAFEEMERLGWIGSARPRMAIVQSEGCAPLVRAFEQGKEEASPVPDPSTCAAGLRVPAAIGDFLVLRAVRASGGRAVAVSEAEILEATRAFFASSGIAACPEGGAALAGLRRLRASGHVGSEDQVVLFNTASGLKYPDVLEAALRV